MPRGRLEWIAFVVCLTGVIALVAIDLRAGHRSGTPARVRTAAAPTLTTHVGIAGASTTVLPKPAPPIASSPSTAPAPEARPPTLVLSATRGNCWLSVRLGSRTGPALYSSVLRKGGTLRFSKAHLWIRFGAAGNLDATLNGKKVSAFPNGTVEVDVTARGVSPVG